MDAPSPNVSNGRSSSGRFAPGNPGGPGNPFAQRVAKLRSTLLKSVTDDDLKQIVQAVVGKAKAGDMAAVRVILDYCVGKPLPAPDPDRAELDGEELAREKRRVAQVKFERESGFRAAL
jgi:hypothetical protein